MINNEKLINILTQLNNWCISNYGNINTAYLQSLTLTEQVSQLFWIIKEFGNQINATIDGFNDLYKFVNDYFNNLDVQNEINNKLNEMSENGELSKIIYPMVINAASPVFVNSESQMIDENRIYVLNNSGMIYYWNGENFVNSGVQYGTQLNNFTYNGTIETGKLSDYIDKGYLLCFSNNGFSDYPSLIKNSPFLLLNLTSSYGIDGEQILMPFYSNIICKRIIGETITEWQYIDLKYDDISSKNITSLKDFKKDGYFSYYVTSGSEKPSDFPDKFDWGSFMLINKTFDDTNGIQFLICENTKNICYRSVTKNTETPWFYINNEGYNGYIPNPHENTLSHYNETGFYIHSVSTSGNVDFIDFPERIRKTNFILENKTDSNGNGLQILRSMFNEQMAFRAIGSSNYDWVYPFFGTANAVLLFGENLQSYLKPGYFYFVVASDTSKPIDYPENINFETFTIENKTYYGSTGYYGMQIMYLAFSDIICTRYVSQNSAGQWKIIRNNSTPFGAPTSKWLAFGDSITAGVYSWKNEDGSSSRTPSGTEYNYPNLISEWYNNAIIDNKAILGLGYAFTDSNPERNIVNVIDSINNWDYDLISIMLGTNDYYSQSGQLGTQSSEANDGTISGNCRYCIEKIMRENPESRLVIISPPNMKSGDISTKYALNKVNNKGFTLIQEMEIIKYWCDYYGIEFINLTTECSEINVLNINTAIADSVHPTLKTQKLLAKSLATKLHFI